MPIGNKAPPRAGPFIFGLRMASERASHRRRRLDPPRRQPTQARADGISVYYPFPLLELVDIGKTDEHAETGEVLLYFLDSDGCQVTLRVSEYALTQLRAKLSESLTK